MYNILAESEWLDGGLAWHGYLAELAHLHHKYLTISDSACHRGPEFLKVYCLTQIEIINVNLLGLNLVLVKVFPGKIFHATAIFQQVSRNIFFAKY